MSQATAVELRQYLTFKLGAEVFAVDIVQVREVLDYSAATRVPRAPDYIRGVINLRGSVVPVVDLKQKFGMGTTDQAVNTCVIITEVDADGEKTVLGMLADSVQEVLNLDPEDIAPLPGIGTNVKIEFIKGMGKRDGRFIMILDIDRIFSSADAAAVPG